VDNAIFHIIEHVVKGEAYGRGMSVRGRQGREGWSFSASALTITALSSSDWHPSESDPSICGGDAACCQITLTTCFTARRTVSLYFTVGRPVTLKIVHSHGAICTTSNSWFLGPTGVLNPNGISIGSAVFTGITTVQTDRQTTLLGL